VRKSLPLPTLPPESGVGTGAGNQELLEALLDDPLVSVAQLDGEGRLVSLNETFAALLGETAAALVGRPLEQHLTAVRLNASSLSGLTRDASLWMLKLPEGRCRYLEKRQRPLREERAEHRLILLRDVTSAIQLEQRVRQRDDLELLGYIAAGAAHEYNELTTAMLGNVDLLEMDLQGRPGGESLVHEVRLLRSALRRAADLGTHLLDFVHLPERRADVRTDCHGTLLGLLALLRRVFPPAIALRHELTAEDPHILADDHALRSAVLTLALQARDTIVNGGTLRLRTCNVHVDEELGATLSPPLPADTYLRVDVQVLGEGDSNATDRLAPADTEWAERGDIGLGIASVTTTMASVGGSVAYSRGEADGLRASLFFRLVSRPSSWHARGEDWAGSRSVVLVVDDERIVRSMVSRLLRRLGYEVLLAADGTEGLRQYDAHAQDIDLVILDIVMPGMDGRQMLELLRLRDPSVPVVLCTGYSPNVTAEDRARLGVSALIRKPYTFELYCPPEIKTLAQRIWGDGLSRRHGASRRG